MNRNNPYTVPEGFFEQAAANAARGAARVRARRRAFAAVAAGLLLIVAVGLGTGRSQDVIPSDYESEWLALAEYDVFLEIE